MWWCLVRSPDEMTAKKLSMFSIWSSCLVKTWIRQSLERRDSVINVIRKRMNAQLKYFYLAQKLASVDISQLSIQSISTKYVDLPHHKNVHHLGLSLVLVLMSLLEIGDDVNSRSRHFPGPSLLERQKITWKCLTEVIKGHTVTLFTRRKV